MITSLSVILLCYNEEKNIEKDINSIKKNILCKVRNSEIIIIEDKSTDKTLKILNKIKSKKITILKPKYRLGYRKSLILGLKKAKKKNIFFCETGQKYDYSEFINFCNDFEKKKKRGGAIYSGFRNPRYDRPLRKILTYLLNLFIRIIFDLNTKDLDSGYKLLNKKLFIKYYCKKGWFVDFGSTEMMLRLINDSYKITEKKVSYYQRPDRSKQFNLYQIIIKSLKLIKSLIKLKRELKN
jgi:glycosyltransferase involved in cell wall biosynthesis